MPTSLPALRVEIDKLDGNKYRSRAFDPAGGEICAHEFEFDPDLLIHIEAEDYLNKGIARDLADVLRGDIRPGEVDESLLVTHGRRLFGYLFGDGRELAAYLKFNPQARSNGLRITLALRPKAAALWSAPWEYLHDDEGFLAVSGRFTIARAAWGLRELDPAPAALPLRILVVVSSPKDLAELNIEQEIGVIQAALDDAIREDKVRLDFLKGATLDALQDVLAETDPHIIHYTGHGAYGRICPKCEALNHPLSQKCDKCNADLSQVPPSSFLALEDDEGKARLVGLEALKPFLQMEKKLLLVFLSGCQTARTDNRDAFAGVATGLLETRLEVAERVRQASELVSARRYLLVFDNFESLLNLPTPPAASGAV